MYMLWFLTVTVYVINYSMLVYIYLFIYFGYVSYVKYIGQHVLLIVPI